MKTKMRWLACLTVLALASADVSAQSEDEARARELVQKIRRDLRRIDALLLGIDRTDPAEARRRMEEVREDLDRLTDLRERLRSVTEKQAEVLEAIDELVKLTKYTQSSSSSGGSNSEEPQDQEEQRNRERERDRDPQQLERQGRPRPERPRGRERPESARPENEPGRRQEDAARKPPSEKKEFERKDTSGRWGVLPPKVQEIFQNLGPDQFPAKYQRLLEEYYRKAARKKEEG